MTILVKLDSGAEIEVEYEDLLVVKRSSAEMPATIELVLADACAAELIDKLLGPSHGPRYLQ